VGFAALLLGTTLLLTERLHFSVLEAALGIAPGPITAGVISPFSGRLARRIGVRSMVLVGAGAFGMSALWPLLSTGETTSYVLGILPSMLLWGVANACIQPTLFAAADAVPKGDVAVGAAVLTVTRQLGSALGVTVLVLALGTEDQASFRYTWSIVLVAAGLTAVAGVLLEQCPPLAEITRGTAAGGSPAVARARLRPSGGPGLRSGRA
jgi:MFS family permease